MGCSALADRLKGRKVAIKLALLDQKVVVGVGNIYVCESLHRAGISPRREAGGLVRKNGQPTARLVELVGHVKDVIEEAIQAGGSTLNDFASVDGTLGYFAHHFAVYGREDKPCEKAGCGGVVRASCRATGQPSLSDLSAMIRGSAARWRKAPQHEGGQPMDEGGSVLQAVKPGVPVKTTATKRYQRASMVMPSRPTAVFKANSCRAEGPGRAQPRGTTRFLD